MNGCGCKICKAGLGEFTNELILTGEAPKSVIEALQKQGVIVSKKLLKKHLAAFEISYPDEPIDELDICEPVRIDLNEVDFSEYNFDINQPETVIAYLQKLNLKVYLNQLRITLQEQQNVIDGQAPNVPKETMQNLAVAYQILDKSSAMGIRVNQQEAIKIVEAMGLTIQNQAYYLPNNVQDTTESEATE